MLASRQRAAAREVEKVLRSAVANAEANHGLLGDDLVVSAAYVDEGPTMKRWRARARGRAARIKKRDLPHHGQARPAERDVARAARASGREEPKDEEEKAGEAEAQAGRPEAQDAAKKTRRRSLNGPESSSRRDARRRHPRLEVELVHGHKEFPAYLLEDIKIREHIYSKLSHAGLSDILIRKDKQRITIDIYTARPGIVIGKSGVEVDALRKDIHG